MRHDIRENDTGLSVLVLKSKLFSDVYQQVDTVFVNKNSGRLKEVWRQVRKVCGEYIGNLYKHDKVVTFAEVEIAWESSNKVIFSICHDGDNWDQFSGTVKPISAGLSALGAAPMTFLGTSGVYEGFKLEIAII